MKSVRLRRWVYRISGTRKWNPVHPSQRFNFPRENRRTSYVGQDLRVCRAEVFGRVGGLVPLKSYWARARISLTVWDLRKPGAELGGALGRWVRSPRHEWTLKALATRARHQGIQGILYTSVRDPQRWCRVIFQENVSRGEFVREGWRPL